MPLRLTEVLSHPSLAPGEPVLVTGQRQGATPVRWVHSSEVLDLAHLLRGGELLLTGGVMLAEATPERQRRYIRELASRGVTGVAVETPIDTELPTSLVEEAEAHGFALIQLRRTVPFVEVAESINGLLINDSVHQLRLADSLSDELSAQLTSDADLHILVATLAHRIGTSVAVQDSAGELLAASGATARFTAQDPGTVQAPIVTHGVVSGALLIAATPETDPALIEAALDRAPQSFGLALLRTRPPSPGTRAARALFRSLRRSPDASDDFPALIAATSLAHGTAFVAVVGRGATGSHVGSWEPAMRGRGRELLSHIDNDEVIGLVALPADEPSHARRLLINDLRGAESGLSLGVGPLARTAQDLPRSVTEARRCLDLGSLSAPTSGIIDAEACSVERLVHRLDANEELRRFIEEQLGGLLDQPPDVRDRLVHTVEMFFDCGANKTETAHRLHLQRQTLYQRLNRISQYLGHDISDPAVLPALHVAVNLRRALDRQ